MHYEAFNIAKDPKYDGYQKDLASMVYKFFDRKTAGGYVKNENMSNVELAEDLHKPIVRKFEKRKVHLCSIDNIWGDDLADMQLVINLIKGFNFCYVFLIFIENMHKIKNDLL